MTRSRKLSMKRVGVPFKPQALSYLLVLALCILSLSPLQAQNVNFRNLEKNIVKAERQVTKAQKSVDEAARKLALVEKSLKEKEADIAEAQAKLAAAQDDKAKEAVNKKIEKLNSQKQIALENLKEAQGYVAEAKKNLDDTKAKLDAEKKALEVAQAQPVPAAVTPAAKTEAAEAPAARKQAKEWSTEPKTLPWNVAEEQQKTLLKGDKPITVDNVKSKEFGTPGAKYEFDVPMISGDKAIVEKLQVWQEWADKVTFNPVTAEEIQDFYVLLVKTLKEEGYIFAKVDFPTRPWAYGIFLAKVNCGNLGQITVKNARHFSEEQLRDKLSNKEGKFNYAKTYGDLFDLNTNPDIKLQTSLKPVIQGGRQVINAEIEVDDKIPIHGAIELRNDGSKETSDWRLRTTLQHLNVTDHFDTFTVDWLTGGLFKHVGEDLNAISGSYFFPDFYDGWSLNVYGGWNQSDIEDVLPEIGVKGRGHYMGAQITKVLRETPAFKQQLSLSWYYQNWKSEHEINGESNFDQRSIILSMPGITLGHVDKVFDSFKGRNFASITIQRSQAGNFGASARSDFNAEGSAFSDGDFTLAKIQIARFQRFFDGQDTPGKWSLFMKTDIQLADDDLPPPMREYIGGFNSVRGYEESEIGGDNSITATFELRTPLIENFIPGLKKDQKFLDDNPEYWGRHRIQFIAFTDLGYAANKTDIPGEINNQDFASIGLGLRLGLTRYSQMSVDYGLPLIIASEDTPEAGRFHISLQAQF